MDDYCYVDTGMTLAACKPMLFKSCAIGSCMVITAFDHKSHVGGMAHILLPGRCPTKKPTTEVLKYTENAIESLAEQLVQFNADLFGLDICLIGCGNVLHNDSDTICQSNIDSTFWKLGQYGWQVCAKEIGGFERRSATLDTATGKVYCTVGDGTEQLLWQSRDTASPCLFQQPG